MGYTSYDGQLLSAHDQWRFASEAAEKARNKALDAGTPIPTSNKNWLNAVLGTLVGGAALLGTRGKAKGLLQSTSRWGRAAGRALPISAGVGAGVGAGSLSEFFLARHNQKLDDLWHQYQLKKDDVDTAYDRLQKYRHGSLKPIGQDILDLFDPGHSSRLIDIYDAYHQQMRGIEKMREDAAKKVIGPVGRVGIDAATAIPSAALGMILTRGRGRTARILTPILTGGTALGAGELGRAWYNARRNTESRAAIEDAQELAYRTRMLLDYEKNKSPWKRIMTGLGLSD